MLNRLNYVLQPTIRQKIALHEAYTREQIISFGYVTHAKQSGKKKILSKYLIALIFQKYLTANIIYNCWVGNTDT